jgi:hypothetical protein
MPILNIEEKVEKVFLPSTQKIDKESKQPTVPEADWGYVVMDTSPLCAADSEDMDETTKAGGFGVIALARRIKDWNYTDQNGQPIPINRQTVGKINALDYGHLMSKISGEGKEMSADEKKASSATSSQRVTVSQQ